MVLHCASLPHCGDSAELQEKEWNIPEECSPNSRAVTNLRKCTSEGALPILLRGRKPKALAKPPPKTAAVLDEAPALGDPPLKYSNVFEDLGFSGLGDKKEEEEEENYSGADSSTCTTPSGKAIMDGQPAALSDLATLLRQTRERMMANPSGHPPANRYGSHARLPPFDREMHVPTLALINPHSGAMAGRDILAIAREMPYYQDRFFNILDVVKDQYRGGLLDIFRIELNAAKEEAKAMGVRARLVSGGGDGTASFALFILFAALRADNARADEGLWDTGNGFIWTDEELAECFPALAQLPLGSANDFGNTLGWGKKYPGDQLLGFGTNSRLSAESALQSWFSAVISPASQVVSFDLWGIMPAAGAKKCDFKVCELGGPRGRDPKVMLDGQKQLLMKEAGIPVPMFACLYFSAGFGAYMTARFQINRRKRPVHNKLEYVRQAAGILTEATPPQLNSGLDGVRISCSGEQYFPPRSSDASGGDRYREVGFLNINWQAGMAHGADRAPICGRLCSTREPAKFNDGKMDMYRLKLTSALKNPGLKYQTDKKGGTMSLTFEGGMGRGVFFQWDGEARFAFSPEGARFSINVRKILDIPVVLGPNYDPKVTGDPNTGCQVAFGFAGETQEERAEARDRVLRYVRGELCSELNATRDDICAAGLPCEEM